MLINLKRLLKITFFLKKKPCSCKLFTGSDMQVLVIEEILFAVWWQCLMSVDGQATSVLQLFASPSSLPKEEMILSLGAAIPSPQEGRHERQQGRGDRF